MTNILHKIRHPGLSAFSILYDIMDKVPFLTYYKGNDVATFAPELLNTSIAIGWPLAWLPTIMFHESSMDPAKVNSKSGATGLIQMIASTAASLGTSDADLKVMPGTQQLPFIKKYYSQLQQAHGKAQSLGDAYLLTFYPAAVGQDDDYVLGGSGTDTAAKIASENEAYDIGNKGYITKGDIEQVVSGWLQ